VQPHELGFGQRDEQKRKTEEERQLEKESVTGVQRGGCATEWRAAFGDEDYEDEGGGQLSGRGPAEEWWRRRE
jgi:hypothetical protein